MSVGVDQLDSFAALGTALGLVRGGSMNGGWFQDPMGSKGDATKRGLSTMIFDDEQRGALLSFVDDVLGPPGRQTTDGAIWVPLFQNADPKVTVYAVVRELAGIVHIGVGVEHDTGGNAPSVATRLHVPIFQLDRSNAPDPVTGGGLPDWLLLGRVGGVIELSADVSIDDGPPVPGEAFVGGVAVSIGVPTSPTDNLHLSVTLRDLQLPGASAPQTFVLDADGLNDLGPEVFSLITGLIRAQANALNLNDASLRPFAALTGLLGLRTVAGLPPLPLADIPTLGVNAIVAWIEGLLNDNTARDAWLGQLSTLIGGALDAPNDAVTFTAGPLHVSLGVRVTPGTGGHPTVVPWVEVAYETTPGIKVALSADLLRADTATGQVSALPAVRAEAVFGVDAGGSALLTGDPGIGSLHLGIGLTDLRTPVFVLTLHNATLAGRPYPLLDLSTPQAALDAANNAISGALQTALAGLGEGGTLVLRLIGLQPPGGVVGINATDLLGNPLGVLAAYWQRLTQNSAAMQELLGGLRRLITGAVEVPVAGDGTVLQPWRVDLVGTSGLRLWVDGDRLAIDLAAEVSTPVLGDFAASASLALNIASIDLVARSASFATRANGALSLHRADHGTASLAVGPVTLELSALELEARWAPASGFGVQLAAPGLALAVQPPKIPTATGGVTRVALSLPTLDANGNIVFAPDWDDVERAVGALLGEFHLPVVDALLSLVGWSARRSGDAHLRLAALIASPRLALEAWLADIVLDCTNVRTVLAPIASLLSGFQIREAIGSGSERSPYRCPVAGASRAPGIAVWLDPGCPPTPQLLGLALDRLIGEVPPEPADIVRLIQQTALGLADVADLMVGRDGLAAGLQTLIDRWTLTDGVVAAPASIPSDVTALTFDGMSYEELVALGGMGALVGEIFDPVPAAVVHVGCEESWTVDRVAGFLFDASTIDSPGAIPAAGNGTWFVRLPSVVDAGLARPDRGGIGEQAARLSAILAARTDPITVLAYGAAGAAAIRTAASVTAIDHLATVGSPWGPVAIDSMQTGLGGDALRLLARLRRPSTSATEWDESLFADEASPMERVRRIVARSIDLTNGQQFPSASAEARRAGVEHHAAFGSLPADDLLRGLAALVADGLDSRLEAAIAAAAVDDVVHTALHAAVDLPVIDLDLAGLLVGAGVTLELLTLDRGPSDTLGIHVARGMFVDVHLGVHDGWLVGGPGATSNDLEVRWMSAHIGIPFDGTAGSAEFVLHDAKAFDVDRERWVVNADGTDLSATTAVTEARLLLGQVTARLITASTSLSDALGALGLVRDGGLDPDGLDRLLHDTAVTMRAALTTNSVALATALRGLTGATGTGASLAWSAGGAQLAVDLAARSASVTLATAGSVGVPSVGIEFTLATTGAAASLSLGSLEANAGGVRLVAHAGTSIPAEAAIEWQAPGAAAPRRVVLAPTADSAGFVDLATTLVPAVIARGAGDWLRSTLDGVAATAFDGVMTTLDLLGPAAENGARSLRLPIGLFTDPVGWLRHGAAPWRADPVGSAIALAEALAPIVAPGRGANPGWPIAPGLTVGYQAADGRLELTATVELDTTIDNLPISTAITAGLSIGTSGSPSVVLDGTMTIDGRGVHLAVAPNLRLELLRPSVAPIPLYPASGGIGSIVSGVGGMVLPPLLDALRAKRNGAPGAAHDLGEAVDEITKALDLVDNDHVSSARLDQLAANPGAWAVAHLPTLAATGVRALATALDPAGALVHCSPSTPGLIQFGSGAGPNYPISVTVEGGGSPAVTVAADFDVPGVGHFALDGLRLSTSGVQVTALIGPFPLDLHGAMLRPLVSVRAGVTGGGLTRMVGVGLALDDHAAESVEFRWTLDAQPPTLVAVTRGTSGETLGGADEAALDLLAIGISLATGVISEALGGVYTARAKQALQGVIYTDANATTLDPKLFRDLVDPDALFTRLKRLAWNVASNNPLSITIDGKVTIGLVNDDAGGGRKRLGINVSLPNANSRYPFPTSGDITVELEVDASWVDPPEPAGLSVFVLEGSVDINGNVDLDLVPAVVVAGVGLRFTKTSGPLLDLGGIGIDGIGLSLYGEAGSNGVGGGARIRLDGLAFSPTAGGGTNPVANSIMNDAGKSGAANRPAFSPSVAIQKHPLGNLSFAVRAGDPPGPWWVVVQRQLGPLYIERVGFDSVEANGTVSRVTLLFDGRVSVFGLTAAVDQLSLSWLGGDFFKLESWAVDLQGLAVSADMAGVSLTGGLLKTTYKGSPSYVGMLLGRFGTYGLSVFGGYTDDNGSPSFFVFGAINGPIGGPPAFFLTGIGGGLGINRGLVIPTDLSNFGEYPFIQALDPGAKPPDDPMGELYKLNDYFPPLRGNFWFAAGISFNSFALVDGVAVIAVSFGEGLEINLLGLARMALPRPQAALVSIELALRARFSTVEGVFMIQAQLTENSWLLYEDVRLTGGFAFAIWWKGPLAGQFVLSIGGYHPDFHRDGYPDVPRLGLVWRVTDDIVVKGGSYFALTSEALMAGVDVEVSADFGWAWAKIGFGANGIVYFDPFWFEVEAYARISAGVQIDTWFGTIGFSISLGATIKVWGPDFSGEATLEVGPCSFGVSFGSERTVAPEVLSWAKFVGKYLEDSGSGTARALSAITGRGTLPAATGGNTGAPSSDGSSDRPFEVFAEFEISIVTTVPTNAVDVAGGSPVILTVVSSSGATVALGLSPMTLVNLGSTVRVVLDRLDDASQTWISESAGLAKLAANMRAAQPKPGSSSIGTDAFPFGAWGTALPLNLLHKPLPKGDVLVAGSKVVLVAEADTLVGGPEIDYYKVESGRRPLPLQATGNDRSAIRVIADGVVVTKPVDPLGALSAARATLFAVRSGPLPDGVMATGVRSGVEHAAFVGQRSAPPLFGTLADGLARLNGADATAARFGPVDPPPAPTVRSPFVAGYLAAGSGAAKRATVTTVGDGQMKRRLAPSLDSVQVRLGRSLPIDMGITAIPAVAADVGTMIAASDSTIPRTVTSGTTASHPGGPIGAGLLQGLVAGLDRTGSTAPLSTRGAAVRAGAPDTIVRSGDVVVLQAPDALIDTDSSAGARPALHVTGRARVVLLQGSGSVLLDGDVEDNDVAIPAGTALIAVQADGRVDGGDGLAGWHARSRVVRLGSHNAVGDGCVITVDGARSAAGGLSWLDAGELVAGAAAIVTRFAVPVRTLAIALTGDDDVRLDPLALELGGARLATTADGKALDPIVVHIGATSVLVYSIVAADDGNVASPVVVRVRSGSDWAVTAVLGGTSDPEDLATLIARRGLVALGAKLLATDGPGSMLTWRQPKGDTVDAAKKSVASAERGGRRDGRR